MNEHLLTLSIDQNANKIVQNCIKLAGNENNTTLMDSEIESMIYKIVHLKTKSDDEE